MPIDVICPKCQTKLRAPEEVVGKNVRCKKCQERFKVPNPGAPVDSAGDTQQLSVVEMPVQPPKPAPVAPAPAEPMLLDDSAFEDPIPAPAEAAVVPKPAALDPFSFGSASVDDDDDRPKKKRKRDEDEDDDRPKKKKKRDEDDEVAAEEPPKKKKRPREDDDEDRPRKKEKPLIGGEPTFAMPGVAEDPAPVDVPPPAHVGQFAFEEPPPAPKGKKKRVDDDDADDEPRPKKKAKRGDDDGDDGEDRPKAKGKKPPAKSRKLLYILGGFALLMLLGCGGAATAVYVFVYRAADAVSKATLTVASGTTVKEETKVTPSTRPTKPTGKEPPVPAGSPVTPFAVPTGLQNGTVVAPGTSIPLPFAPDFVKQVHSFNPVSGPMVLAVYQSNPGFNGVGAEDTVVRHDPGKKAAKEVLTSFTVPADGLPNSRIFDLSNSGFQLAIEAPKGRLTVYNYGDGTASIPIDVHAGLPDRQGIAGIAFAGSFDDRVAVVDLSGAVDVWHVKERQRIVTGKPDPGKAAVAVERRKPNAGKGLIAGKGWLNRVMWDTGEFDPAVKLPAKSGVPTLVTSQTAQDHTAIVHTPEGDGDREVLVVDKAGAAVWRVPLPATLGAPRALNWLPGDAVLALSFDAANGMILLDFASKTPAVYLKPAQDKTILGATGDVSVQPDPKAVGKAVIVKASIPADKLAAMIEAAKNNKTPERLYVKPEGLSQ